MQINKKTNMFFFSARKLNKLVHQMELQCSFDFTTILQRQDFEKRQSSAYSAKMK